MSVNPAERSHSIACPVVGTRYSVEAARQRVVGGPQRQHDPAAGP
jgi:hypothetical protein